MSLTVLRTVYSLTTDVTVQQLEFKERLCREVLQLLEMLGAGQCRTRGTCEQNVCQHWIQTPVSPCLSEQVLNVRSANLDDNLMS
jgi:hypothetical protein